MQYQVIFNGRFLEQRITGVQRYGLEILKELDKICQGKNYALAIPGNLPQKNLPGLKNIKIIRLGKKGGLLWEQWTLANYLRKQKAFGIHFCCDTCLLYPRGIVTIHDLSYTVNKSYFTTTKHKLIALWHRIQNRISCTMATKIVTVSEFSKSQICSVFNTNPDDVTVIYSAPVHNISEKRPTKDIDKKDLQSLYPFLTQNEFFFAMGTAAKNKNFEWILKTAQLNSDKVFAVAGAIDPEKISVKTNLVPNVHFLGYISDKNANLLMRNCRAFLFPSLYEGFGLPPLEAMAQGAPVCCTNACSLPEIYGDTVHYIDPYVPAKDLDAVLDTKVSPPDTLFEKYSFKKSAGQFMTLIESISVK